HDRIGEDDDHHRQKRGHHPPFIWEQPGKGTFGGVDTPVIHHLLMISLACLSASAMSWATLFWPDTAPLSSTPTAWIISSAPGPSPSGEASFRISLTVA